MKTAFICSGQGSQYVGMMKDIYDGNSECASKIDSANQILNFNLRDICFDGPIDILKETRYTQPALFLHSAIIFDLLKDKQEFSAVAGHSVGEYAALYAAGVLSFEDALKLVALRGQLMFEAGNQVPGTMFAVLGMEDDKLVALCNELSSKSENNVIVAANFNSPGQIVVSGNADFLRESAYEFKANGAKLVKELIVSGAFHSPLMEPAKIKLAEAINSTNFNNANVPVYVNVSALPLTNSEEIKTALIQQLTSPVYWTQTLNNMKNDGISNFIEIGAGNVLQGLVKRTLNDVTIKGFDKLTDFEKI